VACAVTEVAVDRERKLVSTPAYMLGKRISEVADGIDKAVGALLDMA
jgi:enhancing lycopene biosynthesis protein 2